MKKLGIIGFLACVLALSMSLVACGGGGASGDDASAGGTDAAVEATGTDFVWYSAQVPDGFEPYPYNGDSCAQIWFKNEDRIIAPGHSNMAPSDEVAHALEIYSDRTAGEDVTYGAYTWKTLDFMWNGNPSCTYYTDYGDGHTFYVIGFEMARDDPDMIAFLSSIQLPSEDMYDASWDTLYTDVM